MTLEKQICSLELSRKLKDLGVKQESVWYWVYHDTVERFVLQNCRTSQNDEEPSAFTVAELGEDGMVYSVYNKRKGWTGQSALSQMVFYADTEADARAKILVYLLENKLITIQ